MTITFSDFRRACTRGEDRALPCEPSRTSKSDTCGRMRNRTCRPDMSAVTLHRKPPRAVAQAGGGRKGRASLRRCNGS